MNRATRRLLGAGTALVTGLVTGWAMLLAVDGTAGAATPPSPAPPAPVAGAAASGGAVIVVLKDQHTNINLGTHARQRMAAVHAEQDPVVSSITADGGTHVVRLTAPNAVAAHLSRAAVARLRTNPAVAEIVPDAKIRVEPANPPAVPRVARSASPSASGPANACPFNPDPSTPLQEGEADTDVHASTGNPHSPDMANAIATGTGVIVANMGANELAGNPNFTRPDGTHVVIDAPDYTADHSNDEDYGDVSSIAAQGTMIYQYSKALPQSNIPARCTFDIKGDAPGASVVDLSEIDTPILATSQVVADIDRMVTTVHADVISESFGTSALPGSGFGQVLAQANDAAVQAGVTVVESSGDSGASGTMIAAADDPNVIATGAVDNFRLVAMTDGYPKYVSNNMAALSSGGTAPTGKVVDLVAPGWYGSEVACADGSGGCPPDYPTESMRGTSEAAPLTAGAAADVIQAYRDTHRGASPTPAVVKSILTSTATDIDAAADQQGAGLLNIYRAVKAAQQMPGTTADQGTGDAPSLVVSPSQLDLTGPAGTTAHRSVQVYNTSDAATTVRSRYRVLGPAERIGSVVTERVSAPAAGAAIPPEGARAAKTVHFRVPAGLDQLDADMIWPDATNSNRLSFQLFNPDGALVQESYDDGIISRNGIPNIQNAAVQDPQPGRWTAKILWGGVDQDLALPPEVPGSYRGTVSFQVSGRHFRTVRAAAPVLIPAHTSGSIPLSIAMPRQAGDHPESVQLSAGNGATTSLPVARRSLVGVHGRFTTLITGTVGRSVGQISTYQVDVPRGRSYLRVTLRASDASADNRMTYYLVNPSGSVVTTATTPAAGAQGRQAAKAQLYTTHPVAGRWTIDVVLDLTTSGKEFTQTVRGTVAAGRR